MHRHERRVVSLALNLCPDGPGPQHRDGHAEDGFALPRRPGRLREDLEDGRNGPDARGGQEDQQELECARVGHQRAHGWKGPSLTSRPPPLGSRADGLLRIPSPQSSHIPYRDSKLTRILQESLGGNSRTTLIINCSPSLYNEAETLSTLRFGMRAKSIKNKARVNAELSPAELKSLLKRAQRENANAGAYIGLLEQEVAVWREGGIVDKEKWASMERALGLGEGELEKLADAGGAAAKQKAQPRTPALDRVSEGGESRPETPSSAMGADEREEFIRRQNEMEDQIAKTVRRARYRCFRHGLLP